MSYDFEALTALDIVWRMNSFYFPVSLPNCLSGISVCPVPWSHAKHVSICTHGTPNSLGHNLHWIDPYNPIKTMKPKEKDKKTFSKTTGS